jgi:hypothetical protein
MKFNPFDGVPKSGQGRIGAGAAVCTFAIELFFIVAFFLFLLFLPIVVLTFQLWWLLALRFCIPPRVGFTAVADFLATGKVIADVGANATLAAELNIALGLDVTGVPPVPGNKSWVTELASAKDPDNNLVFNDSDMSHALVVSTDPMDASQPAPLPVEVSPDDPLCTVWASP